MTDRKAKATATATAITTTTTKATTKAKAKAKTKATENTEILRFALDDGWKLAAARREQASRKTLRGFTLDTAGFTVEAKELSFR